MPTLKAPVGVGGAAATTMATGSKRYNRLPSDLLSPLQFDADTESAYEEEDEGGSTVTASVSSTSKPRKGRGASGGKGKRWSTLPFDTEKALVSILLDPVLERQKPEFAYKGQEHLFGEIKSSLRKAVENRRRYICSPKYQAKNFTALVSRLGLKLTESNTNCHPAPAIIESDDTLPYSGKMQSPPRFIHSPGGSRSGGSNGCTFGFVCVLLRCHSFLPFPRSTFAVAPCLEVVVDYARQAANNGNLFLRASDCDLGAFVPGFDANGPPVLGTACVLFHPLNNPEDYAHTSACITEDGTGILLTRPILSFTLSKQEALAKIYENLKLPGTLDAKHKKAAFDVNGKTSPVGTCTTLYHLPLPDGFVASNQYFAESGAPSRALKPIPVHHDVQGDFGFRIRPGNQKEPIKEVAIYAIAYLFVEKEKESDEAPSVAAPRDINRDLSSTFNHSMQI
jgi:hypothetical protein